MGWFRSLCSLWLFALVPWVGVAHGTEVMGFDLGQDTVSEVLSDLDATGARYNAENIDKPRDGSPKVTIFSGHSAAEEMGEEPVVSLVFTPRGVLYTIRFDWVDNPSHDLAKKLQLALGDKYEVMARGPSKGREAIIYSLKGGDSSQGVALYVGSQPGTDHDVTLVYLDRDQQKAAELQNRSRKARDAMEFSDKYKDNL